MPTIDPNAAHLLGGSTVKRIDASVDIETGAITITCFRDPTGVVPIPEITGTPAETAARVRVGTMLAGAHYRRVQQLQTATMEMLEYVMGQVIVDGKAIAGPDGTPLIGEGMIDAYQHLLSVTRPPETEGGDDGETEGADGA